MANAVHTLNEIAEALKMHPRTVFRHTNKDKDVRWTPSYNPKIYLLDVAKAFGCTVPALAEIIAKKDQALSRQEAADLVNVPVKTFWDRMSKKKYTPLISVGRILRFSSKKLSGEHTSQFI